MLLAASDDDVISGEEARSGDEGNDGGSTPAQRRRRKVSVVYDADSAAVSHQLTEAARNGIQVFCVGETDFRVCFFVHDDFSELRLKILNLVL